MSSTPYDRQTSFALFSAENPTSQQSGTSLDAEFNAVKVALDDTQQNLALIQDDDGAIKRGSVGKAQFDSSVSIGFAAPEQWASGTFYTADVNTVFHASIFYIANTTHTSGASFDATKWAVLADFTVAAVLADGSITSAKLADGAVAGSKLADGVVANSKLATNAVTTNKVADANITASKLAADVPASLVDSIFPAGMLVPFAGSTAPTGWLLCFGQSVPRADYPALFTAISTTYGSADGTHFNMPDMRGRVPGGKDNMGGSAASRLTNAASGVDGATLGASGGLENVTLTTQQIPSHTHANTVGETPHSHTGALNTGAAYNSPGGATTVAGNATTSTGTSSAGVTINNAAAGGGLGHFNVQPTLVLNYIIKAH